jgi:methanogenic corrinoid protein MtbC1
LGISKNNSQRRVLIGTVEGDVHDIGKNILKSLIEISGFEVEDIGIDQKPEAFVRAIKEYRPRILGLSAVLTVSIEAMKRTVDAIVQAELREGLKITIGGNAVSAEVCHYVGADSWSKNARDAVKVFETWF